MDAGTLTASSPRRLEALGAVVHPRSVPGAASHCGNALLAALPGAELERIAPLLHTVHLSVGQRIYEPGTPSRRALFPTTAVVSLYNVLESGACSESAAVGFEGIVEIPVLLGGNTASGSAAVEIAGTAYAIETTALIREFRTAGALQSGLLRYLQFLMAQMHQTSTCNRHHAVHEQVSSWLLRTLDRIPTREIVVTQDRIAAALGVRRECVSAAAGALRKAGLIRCGRGRILIVDRLGLEKAACECYAVIRYAMNRLLRDVSGGAAAEYRSLGLRRDARSIQMIARPPTPGRL